MGQACKSVLIFEDEPLIAMELEALVQSTGSMPLRAPPDLRDALNLIAHTDADAAIVDIGLDSADAAAVAAALRKLGKPWIFTSAAQPEELGGAFAGIPVIAKPFKAAQIIAQLQRML